jgi:hypothetical protein
MRQLYLLHLLRLRVVLSLRPHTLVADSLIHKEAVAPVAPVAPVALARRAQVGQL